MIELLETSKDPQISKGVDALKQLFLHKKVTVPRFCLRFRKCVLVKSPLTTLVDRHLVNSTAPRGQHLVKCVLNHALSALFPVMPWGPGFQLTNALIIAHHN